MRHSARRLVILAGILSLLAGCSGSQPKKVQLSGKVIFKGKPVPAGYISFMPEFGQGNEGRDVRLVQIKDGVFDSAREQDPGVYPGPTIVRIFGFDGKPMLPLYPQGKQIFNAYELKETLAEGTKDFTVPDWAGRNVLVIPNADP
jgi:hypothetical protein